MTSKRPKVGFKRVGDTQFIERGSIRLGAPDHYGRIEGSRRDPVDSGRVLAQNPVAFSTGDGRGKDFSIFNGAIRFINSENCSWTGAPMGAVVVRQAAQMFIFCLAATPENKFAADDGPSAVYQIDLVGLERALREAAPELGPAKVARVTYANVHDSGGEPNPFVKDQRFKDEDEIRMVFPIVDPAFQRRPYFDVEIGARADIFERVE